MLTADEPVLPSRPAYKVERTLRVTHSINYRYKQPVRDVTTRLCLLPPPARGAQVLRDSSYHLAPLPIGSWVRTDAFGNQTIEVQHDKIWEHLTMVVEMELETASLYSHDGRVLPACLPEADGLPPEGIQAFLNPTLLTPPTNDLEEIATALGTAHAGDPYGLAFALCRRVYTEMEYAPKSTSVDTTAAEAWAGRKGVCQDFSHLLLVLCRFVGLPARYVSGFLPGEGAMHAWIEVLLPVIPEAGCDGTGHKGWVALDPTHDRWVNERYVTIAVGRDYRDITPTSGSFIGAGPGPLSHRSKVLVEKTTQTPL